MKENINETLVMVIKRVPFVLKRINTHASSHEVRYKFTLIYGENPSENG